MWLCRSSKLKYGHNIQIIKAFTYFFGTTHWAQLGNAIFFIRKAKIFRVMCPKRSLMITIMYFRDSKHLKNREMLGGCALLVRSFCTKYPFFIHTHLILLPKSVALFFNYTYEVRIIRYIYILYLIPSVIACRVVISTSAFHKKPQCEGIWRSLTILVSC